MRDRHALEPARDVQRELEQMLETDATRLGDVYRLSKRGLNPDEIALELGVKTSGFVGVNRRIIQAIFEGSLPAAPVYAKVVAGSIRKRVMSGELSEDARNYLGRVLEGRTSVDEAATAEAPQQLREERRPLSLRTAVDDEVRRRVVELVDRIQVEAELEPDDYHRAAAAGFVLDQVEHLILRQTTGPTTSELYSLDRLDLSIEQAVTDWSADLPLWTDLVSAARGRLNYWRDR